ncbi:GAF domain-containing protein [Blastococcus sp. SYSU D01042]
MSRAARTDLPLADELAGVFARMSGLLLTEETVDTSLSVLSALAHETVPGSCGAGVSIIEARRRTSAGSTDDRVREADGLQYELDEGPCLAATEQRELVVVEDVRRDRRWPRWAEAVAPLELGSALSAPLVAGDHALGAIKVYADHPGAFDDRSRQLLTLFSAQAALLVANVRSHERAERLSDGMRRAVGDRDLINVAKGVLIGRHGMDEEAAQRMLVARSLEQGVPLADAARKVLAAAGRRRHS